MNYETLELMGLAACLGACSCEDPSIRRVLRMESGVILLVEDTPDYRETLAALLRSEGFVVREAVDGIDAFSQLDRGLIPDLILTDWTMPGMDGRIFCSKLRKDPVYRKIPVIVISSVDVIKDDLSVAATFRKPVRLKTLLDTIRNF